MVGCGFTTTGSGLAVVVVGFGLVVDFLERLRFFFFFFFFFFLPLVVLAGSGAAAAEEVAAAVDDALAVVVAEGVAVPALAVPALAVPALAVPALLALLAAEAVLLADVAGSGVTPPEVALLSSQATKASSKAQVASAVENGGSVWNLMRLEGSRRRRMRPCFEE